MSWSEALKLTRKYLNKLMVVESVTGIYFLIKDEKIVYVGQSTNIFSRVGTHKIDKDFDKAVYFECPSTELDDLEYELINILQPKYNKTGNPKKYYSYLGLKPSKSEASLTREIERRIQAGKYSKRTVKSFQELGII